MPFEYDQKFYSSVAEEFGFASLADGASLFCEAQDDARTIAAEFNYWAFCKRSPLIASARKTSISDTKKKKGFRVWILTNRDGPDAYDVDALKAWASERVEKRRETPAEGWPKTSDLYRDFIAWAAYRKLSRALLPPVNTFSRNIRQHIDADFRRRAEGMIVIGAALKKTDMEAANGIDPEPL